MSRCPTHLANLAMLAISANIANMRACRQNACAHISKIMPSHAHAQSGRDRIGSSGSSNGNAGRVSGELVPTDDGAGGDTPGGGDGDGGGGGGDGCGINFAKIVTNPKAVCAAQC